jgi:hypothetical protein
MNTSDNIRTLDPAVYNRSVSKQRVKEVLLTYSEGKKRKSDPLWRVVHWVRPNFRFVWTTFPELVLHTYFIQNNRIQDYPLESKVNQLRHQAGECKTMAVVSILLPFLTVVSAKRFLRGRNKAFALSQRGGGLVSTGLLTYLGYKMLTGYDNKAILRIGTEEMQKKYREMGVDMAIAEQEYIKWLDIKAS